MPWIKRNLLFVIGLAVSLVLFGVGVFYTLGQRSRAQEVSDKLAQNSSSLDSLFKQNPFPNEENIKAAKAEQLRVLTFRTNLMTRFPSPVYPAKLQLQDFKEHLEKSVAAMVAEADRNGVKLPKDYDFTFTKERKSLEISAGKLPILAGNVTDITHVLRTIFSGKIHELSNIKRSTVMTDDFGNDFHSRKPSLDKTTGLTAYPYEVTFHCFSAELANVLAALANAPQMIVVKTLNIEHADPNAASTDTSTSTAGPAGMNPLMARYGMSAALMGRYGVRPPTPEAAAPATSGTASKTGAILDESSIKVTLGINVMRQAPAESPEEKEKKARAARSAPAPGTEGETPAPADAPTDGSAPSP